MSRGEKLPIGIDVPIRDPEKNLTDEELETLQPNISLVEQLNELRPPVPLTARPILGQVQGGVKGEEKMSEDEVDDEVELSFTTRVAEEEIGDTRNLENSSELEIELNGESIIDSSDLESRSSDDSITRNADFVSFQ